MSQEVSAGEQVSSKGGMSSPLLTDPSPDPPTAHTVSANSTCSTPHLAYGREGEKIQPFPLTPTIHNLRVSSPHSLLVVWAKGGVGVTLTYSSVRVQSAPLSTLWKGHLEVP